MKTVEEFVVRSYSKSELAQLYNPQLTPAVARQMLRRWINASPGLLPLLQSLGYRTEQRILTPRMVQYIVEQLGEP